MQVVHCVPGGRIGIDQIDYNMYFGAETKVHKYLILGWSGGFFLKGVERLTNLAIDAANMQHSDIRRLCGMLLDAGYRVHAFRTHKELLKWAIE